ncbi:nucleoside deaminase [Alkalicoccus daliensis]|uniref:tRNA(Arg) A34 adenosine deaminase TadA n=1 Tax=Alkalicoccus daliensis TaxID=745820 RepID=A0A1H0KBV2_9BACI|nr:nucleoside deaminase [Alkalicoccus daliensis]SDO53313.1 tRNA(Arg) A34 adenosine deaminase TadA [Alkalicoccus daliensis]
MTSHEEWIERCIAMAGANADAGQMPFASIIVRDGEEVARGLNDGKAAMDPTAHGEIRALQAAGKKLKQTDLTGCILYTNCEPCPMCLGAVYWSGIKEVYYGLSIEAQAEFDQLPKYMYEEFQRNKEDREVKVTEIKGKTDSRAPFKK